MKFADADGRGPTSDRLALPGSVTLANGMEYVSIGAGPGNTRSSPLPDGHRPIGRISTQTQIVRVVLDGVLFEDGLFIGPDSEQLSGGFAIRLQAAATIGAELLASENKTLSWIQLREYASPRKDAASTSLSFGRRSAASKLVETLDTYGESAALELAAKYAALPTLRKGQ